VRREGDRILPRCRLYATYLGGRHAN
jgi:hypothetical protein